MTNSLTIINPAANESAKVPVAAVVELERGALEFGVSVPEFASLILVGWARRREERRGQERAR